MNDKAKGVGLKIVKGSLMVIATLVMALCLFFVPESSGTVSITFVSVLGLYLGLDVAAMITKTTTLKKGDFEDMNVYKYVLSAICLLILIGISIYLKNKCDVSTALTSFIASVMIIIGCIITGLEGNKIATNADGSGDTQEEINEQV